MNWNKTWLLPNSRKVCSWLKAIKRWEGGRKEVLISAVVPCQGHWYGDTYKYIILYPYHVATSQVGWRKRRHKQLFWLPIICLSSFDLSPGYGRKFPRFRLHHFVFCDVLDCLKVALLGTVWPGHHCTHWSGLWRVQVSLPMVSAGVVWVRVQCFTTFYGVVRKKLMLLSKHWSSWCNEWRSYFWTFSVLIIPS